MHAYCSHMQIKQRYKLSMQKADFLGKKCKFASIVNRLKLNRIV